MFQTFILTGYLLGIFLFTGCHAQSSEDSLRTVTEFLPTSTRDPLLPESTSFSFAAPSGTGQPCARIANAVESAIRFDRVAVPAELAYECLTSVPVGRTEALGTIDALLKMVQFQSNLAYLRDPPEGYENPPVDIIAGLEDIRNRASSNEYSNQFDFEAAIATLLNSARDGHLGFDGPTFASAVAWRRDFATVLVSVTLDDGQRESIMQVWKSSINCQKCLLSITWYRGALDSLALPKLWEACSFLHLTNQRRGRKRPPSLSSLFFVSSLTRTDFPRSCMWPRLLTFYSS